MSNENWERLGQLLIERRVKLKYPKRAAFARDKGQKTDRILAAIENGERQNFDRSTLALIEDLYEWQHGSIDAVLAGGLPIPLEERSSPAVAEAKFTASGKVTESMFDRLTREADEAQAEFERLVGEMTTAEAKVDATSRRVFRYIAMEMKYRDEAERRSQELGRPLTTVERMTVDGVDRPTSEEIAELVATHATIDPHEWTRYEMALVERVEPGYLEDVTKYSKFADLSAARAQVARLKRPPSEEMDV